MLAPDPHPGPAGAFLERFLRFVPVAEPATIAAFVGREFVSANATREPIERRIASFMDWRARGGFEILEVEEETSDRIAVRTRMRRSDEHFRMVVELEDEGVASLLLGRIPLPVLATPRSDDVIAEDILAYVGSLAQAEVFSGAVLVARHGTVLAQGAFGLANRDFEVPNTVETRFNVASLTKSWTAVGICQLVEAGAIRLDDQVAHFIDYPDRESADAIRIEHLLSHTSGLGDYFIPTFASRSRRDLRTCADYLELCRHCAPEFPAGTRWRYSNVGMVLLGRIIELVTGTDYFDYVQEAVLARAGMKQAGFPSLDEVNPGTAVGYHRTWTENGAVIVNSLFEGQIRATPAGCGYATVRDIFAFAEAFRNGRLVSDDMAHAMTSAKDVLHAPDYGYGFYVHPERALYGHSGGLIGASANVDITCEPEGWVIVVLCNDLSMRAPVLKARQIIGVRVPEAEEARGWLPRSGLVPR